MKEKFLLTLSYVCVYLSGKMSSHKHGWLAIMSSVQPACHFHFLKGPYLWFCACFSPFTPTPSHIVSHPPFPTDVQNLESVYSSHLPDNQLFQLFSTHFKNSTCIDFFFFLANGNSFKVKHLGVLCLKRTYWGIRLPKTKSRRSATSEGDGQHTYGLLSKFERLHSSRKTYVRSNFSRWTLLLSWFLHFVYCILLLWVLMLLLFDGCFVLMFYCYLSQTHFHLGGQKLKLSYYVLF